MRRDECEDTIFAGFGVAFVILIALAVAMALSGCGQSKSVASHERSASRFIGDGWNHYGTDDWEFSTITDTETGIVYLVYNTHNGRQSLGGITPLLKGDGSVTIDERYAVDGSKS